MNTLKYLALVPALMLIAAAGCIKRSETITIFEDGRLWLTAEIVGDPDDVYNGDAMPTAESGWQIEDNIQTDSEGKKELTRKATRFGQAGAAIPDSYATPNSRLDLTALQFPTMVTIERRSDGTYFRFRRTYHRREYSVVQYWKVGFNGLPSQKTHNPVTDTPPRPTISTFSENSRHRFWHRMRSIG